ncbi:MAG: ATP-binding protein [Patescibacteria group bacterium]|jgi:DNA replication protein DnaC/primosomal protein DnaI
MTDMINNVDLKELFEQRRKKRIIKLRPFSELVAEIQVQQKDPVEYIKFINREINCPEKYVSALPDNMDQQLKDWAAETDGSTSLYIYGSVGTGKTFGAYALAKLYKANKIKVRVKNFADWLDKLRSYYDDCRSEYEIKEEMRDEAVLILDDLGVEKQTDWTQEIMDRLVNARYEQIRPTIFTSNLAFGKLGERYGDRVASRIVEMVSGSRGIIKIDGNDRRLRP